MIILEYGTKKQIYMKDGEYKEEHHGRQTI